MNALNERGTGQLRELENALAHGTALDVHDARQADAHPFDEAASVASPGEQIARDLEEDVQRGPGPIAVGPGLD